MRTSLFNYFVFAIVVHQCWGDDGGCSKKVSHLAPARLKYDLLCDYDQSIRPVVNHGNATNVTIRMVLKFFSYEMHSNTISVHNWLALYWKDEHLKWDPAKYESIKQIHITSDSIWMPDLSVYNRNDQSGSPKAISSVDCLVTSTGSVVCVPPGRHDALCMPNLVKYPYDVQNCTLRFGSWVHSGEEIDFKIPQNPVTLDDYMPNGEWKLISVTIRKFPGHYNCCPDNSYPSLSYSFLIERHSATQAATVIIPALVLFARDSLLLCTFSLLLTVILKTMKCASKQSPAWVSTVVSGVLSNRPGQFLLLYDVGLKDVATAKGEDDGTNIINNETPSTSKDWHLFAKLVDRLSFFAFAITYFCMFITFIA